MKRTLPSMVLALALAVVVHAAASPDAADLTRLLNEFLAGASRDDAAAHERFWAEDLIYTGSSGRRIGKADILREVRSAPTTKPGDPITRYSAEDVRIQEHGDTAVVAFRLIGATEHAGRTGITNYLNTGTFRKRDGRWQAVAWQATRMPQSEEEATKEAAAARAAFDRAILAGDAEALEASVDESFVWTDSAGARMTRREMLDRIASGRLRYSKLEAGEVTVSLYGEAAVVRGVARTQPSPSPGSGEARDAGSWTEVFTMTLVRKDGAWKVVALHTSRP